MSKANVKTSDTLWSAFKKEDTPVVSKTFGAYRKLLSTLLQKFGCLKIIAEICAEVGTTKIPMIESKNNSILLDISSETLKKAKQLNSILKM
ncbi:MAG: hypothetical protein NWE90_00415 [Candidatus Bathyarchaeota archaeon]|nr:hypothetical protein [Candidatus Bathyarchaeota archaeon]